MISLGILAWYLLHLGISVCNGQFSQLQPESVGRRMNPGNLTARSYQDGAGRVPSSISTGYRSSMVSDPFMHYPNTDNMIFRLPGAPRPPDPPSILGGGGSLNYQPYLNGWNSYPGGGSGYSSNNGGIYSSSSNNGNNYFSGGGSNTNSYGSNSGYNQQQQQQQTSGNGAINYGASGSTSNGYRPAQQTGPGSNSAYGGNSQSGSSGSNVQNGYIVSSSSSNGGTYGNSNSNSNTNNNNNQYAYPGGTTTSISVQGGSGYGSNGGYGSSSGMVGSDNGAAYTTAKKTCRPDALKNHQGYCTLRNQLKRKCSNLASSFSSDCSGKEMCCFDQRVTVPPTSTATMVVDFTIFTTTVASTTGSTSGGGMGGGVTTGADRYCIPDTNPAIVDGVCRSNLDVVTRCSGIFASTSSNCFTDESCCYNMNVVSAVTATPTAATLAPTQTTSTTTTTVSPTTTVPIGPGGAQVPGCSPGSFAAITNGVCTPQSQIAQSCKGKQISPSVDCKQYEYCCFVADAPVGDGFYQPGVTCSPNNNPMVGNGRCVDPGQIATQCPGMLLSNSVNCQSNQLCCYNSQTTTATRTTTATTATTSTAANTNPTSSPSSASVTSTTGTTSSSTSTSSSTTIPVVSTSTTTSASTGSTQLTTESVTRLPSGPSCRPGRFPYHLPNGTCVSPSQLSQQCKGLQLDYSNDCDYYQYCCYNHGTGMDTGLAPVTIAPGSCTPDSNPTVNNGVCVDNGDLMARCSGIEASTSLNCDTTQFCCYSQAVAGTTSTTVTPPESPSTSVTVSSSVATAATTSSSSPNTCVPDNNSAITTGMCVDGSQVSTVCSKKEMSTSNECAAGQFCCYSAQTGTTPSTTSASTPPTSTLPQLSTTSTVPTTQSSTLPSSTSSGAPSRLACSPQGYPNILNGLCTSLFSLSSDCRGLQASPSLSCGTYEYCCFDSSTTPNGPPVIPSGFCSPDSAPAITNGICVFSDQLTAQCGANDMSTSAQCLVGQFCCFSPTGIQITTPRPNTAPPLPTATTSTTSMSSTTSKGTTLTSSPTTSATTPSSTSTSTTTSTVPTTTSTITSTTSVQSVPTVATTSVPISTTNAAGGGPVSTGSPPSGADMIYGSGPGYGYGSVNPGSVGSCIPITAPETTDGFCVDLGQLAAKCQGGRVAKSNQCLPYQYCCFGAGSLGSTTTVVSPVTSTTALSSVTSTTVSTSTTASLQCSPVSAPTVINGVCADVSQLSIMCHGMRVSRAPQCSTYQYCCFEGEQTTTGSTLSSTTTQQSSTSTSTISGSSIPPRNTTTTTSSSITSPSGSNSATCTPSTAPSVTDGVCVDLSQIASQCQGQRISKSSHCQQSQYCCFTTESNGGGDGGQPSGTCTPQSAPSVHNGTCVFMDNLAAQCKAQRVSKSNDCTYNQFCCYMADSSSGSGSNGGSGNSGGSSGGGGSNEGGCSPNTTPQVKNGVCTDVGQLSSTCRGKVFSKSSGCLKSQFCCFNSPYGGSSSTASPGSGNQPSSTACTPKTQPSINNGMCVPTSQLSTRCRSLTFSKSGNCSGDQFCCFGPAAPPGDTWALPGSDNGDGGNVGGVCSPNTDPGSRGKCVATDNLAAQCSGMRLSKSGNCSSGQFCCFLQPSTGFYGGMSGSESSSAGTGMGTGSGSGTGTGTGTETGGGIQQCTPNTQPTIKNGVCVSTNQLSTQCKQLTFSKSTNCSTGQFCCFSASEAGTGSGTTSPLPLQGAACSPSTAPEVTNGACFNSGFLVTKCHALRISKSPNCGTDQYCCFSAPAGDGSGTQPSTPAPPPPSGGVACSPNSAPAITNGRCVSTNDLKSQCGGQRVSKSNTCQAGQFCCFGDVYSGTPSPTGGPSGNQPDQTRSSCSPQTEPSVTNGQCVSSSNLTTQCVGQRLSKSPDCQYGQYCCFTASSAGSGSNGTAGGSCTPKTQPSIHNGVCVETSQLSAQCAGQRLSKSTNCSNSQFCCFSVDTTGNGGSSSGGGGSNPGSNPGGNNGGGSNPGSNGSGSQSGSCTPLSNPSVSNGVCLDMGTLSSGCHGKQLAKSSDCTTGQFCCFSNPAITPTPAVTCTPNTEPSVMNGTCVDVYQLTSQCQDRRFSKSGQCQPSQFCCFSVPIVSPQNQCTPETEPTITNGVCLVSSDLPARCNGGGFRAAKSINCLSSQWCCFGGYQILGMPAALLTGSAFSQSSTGNGEAIFQNISMLNGGGSSGIKLLVGSSSGAGNIVSGSGSTNQFCSPNSDSSVVNGVCMSTKELPTRCVDQRASPSADCPRFSWCCFGFAGLAPTTTVTPVPEGIALVNPIRLEILIPGSEKLCTPNTDLGVHDGKCTAPSDVGAACAGQRLSRSPDCDASHFCCFTRVNLGDGLKLSIQAPKICTPDTDTVVHDGKCTEVAKVGEACRGQQLAKSGDCAPSQFCCFNRSGSESDTKLTVEASKTCVPSTDESARDGRCMEASTVSQACRGQQLAKSNDCGPSQFCCFTRSTLPAVVKLTIQAPTVCTPSTDTMVHDGKCIESSTVGEACSGQQLAKSNDCGPSQFCCFTRRTSESSVKLIAQSAKVCTPKTDSSVHDGKCTAPADLDTTCTNQPFSKSDDCDPAEFCCFTRNSTVAVVPPKTCTPQTDISVHDGQCTALADLDTACGTKQFTKSNDCDPAQFCCFNRNSSPSQVKITIETPILCTPNTDTSVHDGKCTDSTAISTSCLGLQVARSDNCDSSQFCCFNHTTSTSASKLAIGAGKACTPQTDTDVHNGKCIDTSDVGAACSGQPFSKSNDCLPSQFCCFTRPDASVTNKLMVEAAKQCTPGTDSSVHNGKCIASTDLGEACNGQQLSKSDDCGSGQFCCFTRVQPTTVVKITVEVPKLCTPNTDRTVHDGRCATSADIGSACAGQQLSKSDDCVGPEQFCCFNRTVTAPVPVFVKLAANFTLCTPNVDTSVHDGQCMRMREIGERCVDRKASPSSDCAMGQWCCFGDSSSSSSAVALTSDSDLVVTTTATTTTTTALAGQCAPNSRPALRNGVCLTIRELQASCVERQAAPSLDCEMGRWCCYTEPGGNRNKDAEDGATDAMEVVTAASTAGSFDGLTCTPNAEPTVDNGSCMPTKDLRTRCRNRRVSKSPQCRTGQWCCFTDLHKGNSTDFSPIGRSLVMGTFGL